MTNDHCGFGPLQRQIAMLYPILLGVPVGPLVLDGPCEEPLVVLDFVLDSTNGAVVEVPTITDAQLRIMDVADPAAPIEVARKLDVVLLSAALKAIDPLLESLHAGYVVGFHDGNLAMSSWPVNP